MDFSIDEETKLFRDAYVQWAEIDNADWRQSNDRYYQQHSN